MVEGIVTLVGSSRFSKEFEEAKRRLSLNGWLVFDPGLYAKPGGGTDAEVWEAEEARPLLCQIHDDKIRLAEWVLVIDPGGYVGAATTRQIALASSLGTPIRHWSLENWRGVKRASNVLWGEDRLRQP